MFIVRGRVRQRLSLVLFWGLLITANVGFANWETRVSCDHGALEIEAYYTDDRKIIDHQLVIRDAQVLAEWQAKVPGRLPLSAANELILSGLGNTLLDTFSVPIIEVKEHESTPVASAEVTKEPPALREPIRLYSLHVFRLKDARFPSQLGWRRDFQYQVELRSQPHYPPQVQGDGEVLSIKIFTSCKVREAELPGGR
ncbi:MAG: hypothetical protein C5B49_12205 [Bdellovibrio sp.]|nr:MAG: hypothetical protein C5B49_12205 [Bdellovibrio sp.]